MKSLGYEDIRYDIKNGELQFFNSVGNGDKLKDIVPEEILDRGLLAVKEYVNEKIAKYNSQQIEKRNQFLVKIKSTNMPITTNLLGVIINGTITHIGNNTVLVTLEEPKQFKGIHDIPLNYATTINHNRIFNENGDLNDWVIIIARKELINIYIRNKGLFNKAESNPRAFAIMTSLNKEMMSL